MIEVITFDLWNTIFNNRFYTDVRLNYFIQFLNKKQIGNSFQNIKEAFDLAFDLSERNYEENNHIYTEERITRLLKNLKIDMKKSDMIFIKNKFEEAMLKDPPSLKEGAKRILKQLSSNYRLGLISNTGITPGRIINKVFQNYGILDYFKVKIYSDEIGYYKPHKILFRTALKRLNCKPQNAIHIGDNLETDIKGAKDCNMYSIWFNELKSLKSKKIQPDYEISKITEVLQIIKGFK